MTQPFPDDLFLTGATAPSGIECDAPDLIIEGELPADLQGVYFRNGPDPLHPPREGQEYHWFHGDGMIQRFEFSNGRVPGRIAGFARKNTSWNAPPGNPCLAYWEIP